MLTKKLAATWNTYMKAIVTGLVLMCLVFPINAQDAQEVGQQQKSLDTLLSDIQLKRAERSQEQNVSPEVELRRVKSQLIDTRVERDMLQEENSYLRQRVNDIENEQSASLACPPGECITLEEAQEQQLIQHVVYSLSLFRLAEFMDSVIPEEDVEAHKKAQKIMDGAKADLELLGFDTTTPEDFPSLEELLERFDIEHEAHGSRLSTD